jgi:uncharacterized protein (DUF1697 family)
MPKYVGFLRAINVGGHTVKMDQLRLLFESLGFLNEETFIASGNVIFESPGKNAKALEKKIERCLHEKLGYHVGTFIRSRVELAAIAHYQPFSATKLKAEGSNLYIAFLAEHPSEEAKKKLLSLSTNVDELHVSAREVYWLCRTSISESAFSGARLEKTLGMQATFRNATTVRKLALKYS